MKVCANQRKGGHHPKKVEGRKEEVGVASCCQLLPAAGLPVAICISDKQRESSDCSEN